MPVFERLVLGASAVCITVTSIWLIAGRLS